MIRRFLKNERGSAALVFALAIIPLLLAAGFAVDYLRMSRFKNALQGAVDAAALAGASHSGGSNEQRIAAALASFNKNKPVGEALADPVITVTNPGTTLRRVRVYDKANVSLTFMGLKWTGTGATEAAVSAAATAQSKQSPLCLLTLNQSTGAAGAESFGVNSNVTVNSPDCALHVNAGIATNALDVNANSTIRIADVCKAGGADIAANSQIIVTGGETFDSTEDAQVPTCAPKPDPLATGANALPTPDVAAMTCMTRTVVVGNGANATTVTTTDWVIEDDMTLQPGRYCGRVEIEGHGAGNRTIVTLVPGGQYYFGGDPCVERSPRSNGTQCQTAPAITGGPLTLDDGSDLIGTDNLLYFTGNNDSTMILSAGANINLRGRSSGFYRGVAIMQRNVGGIRADETPWTDPMTLNSNADSSVEGVIYLPESKLLYRSNTGSDPSPWMAIISYDMEVRSGGAGGENVLNVGAAYGPAGGAIELPQALIDHNNTTSNIALIE